MELLKISLIIKSHKYNQNYKNKKGALNNQNAFFIKLRV